MTFRGRHVTIIKCKLRQDSERYIIYTTVSVKLHRINEAGINKRMKKDRKNVK